MKEISLIHMRDYASTFIPKEFIPRGQDENTIRNEQNQKSPGHWRGLVPAEIETLLRNGNTACDWGNLLVADPFDPGLVRGSSFYGLVRIGRLEPVALEHHDLRVPVGIADSFIISCDIGDNCAIRNVHYAAHYIVGDTCMLLNIDELHTTNHAKFGNGIVMDGEGDDARIWLALGNEAGGREVLPFDGILPADAYIWFKYRDDIRLQTRLVEMTDGLFDKRRGYYGVIGNECVVKNSGTVKDVLVGSHCYIKGANKLKNLTINSSEAEPTQIGEGVELTNGIVGFGCKVFYGCKAVRFVLGRNSSLKYGARIIHSFLGDNSTVSCCEILHNLIFPGHEQHHNNSFLISSCILGQSNIAAGATIGSNHNSRANDGEILAGRGFWPGLSVTLKHSSRFASFVLLAKGDYPAEMHVPLPFALVTNDVSLDELHIMPAYFWMYNMYALERNSWKFSGRDKRIIKAQAIEFAALAPDTAEEIFHAMKLLAVWIAKAHIRSNKADPEILSLEELALIGEHICAGGEQAPEGIKVLGEGIEYSKRKVVILKAREAYNAYRNMLYYYSIINIIGYFISHKKTDFAKAKAALVSERETNWVNIGGQLVREQELTKILEGIKSETYDSWDKVHSAYELLEASYTLEKQRHAFATLVSLLGVSDLTKEKWNESLDRAVVLQEHVRDQVYITRKKDYENPIRRSTFRNEAEMKAVLGDPEDNSFVKHVERETERLVNIIRDIKQRG